MYDMPMPVALAFAALIGWPAIQVIALLVWVRPKRATLRTTANALRCDPAYSDDEEQLAITAMVAEASGSPMMVVAPIILPVASVALAMVELLGQRPEEHGRSGRDILKRAFEAETGYPPDGSLWADERFRKLHDVANDLSIESWPVSLGLMVAGLVITLPLWGIAYGLKRSTVRLFRTAAQIFTRSYRFLTIAAHRE